METIGAILVNYGRSDLGIRTIKSFIKTTKGMNVKLVVIDTGIPDYENARRTNEILELVEQGLIFCLVSFNANMGKGYSLNLGQAILKQECKYLNISEPEYYVHLDNDVIFRDRWLELGLEVFKQYQNTYPMLSFYQGGADCHLSGEQLVYNLKEGYAVKVVNSCEGMCWLLTREAVNRIGENPTDRPISGTDWFAIRKLQESNNKFLVLEGLISHIGFGHSTHRGELGSWDFALAHDTMLKKKYGTITD